MEAATARARRAPALRLGGAFHRLSSDKRLVERFRAGDEEAFEVLFERYRSKVYAICLGVLGSKEDAEDAMQEAFTSASRGLAGTTPDDIKPWLGRIARNAAIDVARARRVTAEQRDTAAPVETEPASRVQRRAEFDGLMAGLRELPEQQRTALVMRELAGYSYAEIGTALDTDQDGVRGLISRARISLRAFNAAQDLECHSVRDRLAGELDGRRRPAELRRHLRGCSGCREFQVGLRGDARALRGLMPAGAGLGLLALFAGTRAPKAAVMGGVAAKIGLTGPAATLTAACVVSVCTVGGVRELGVDVPGVKLPLIERMQKPHDAPGDAATKASGAVGAAAPSVWDTPAARTTAGPPTPVERRRADAHGATTTDAAERDSVAPPAAFEEGEPMFRGDRPRRGDGFRGGGGGGAFGGATGGPRGEGGRGDGGRLERDGGQQSFSGGERGGDGTGHAPPSYESQPPRPYQPPAYEGGYGGGPGPGSGDFSSSGSGSGPLPEAAPVESATAG